MDFAYLSAQTFGDRALERELLELFVDQARRLIAGLPAQDGPGRANTTHLLKGSARAIGADRVAEAAEACGMADLAPGPALDRAFAALTVAFVAAEVSIEARLSELAASAF